MNLQGDEPLMNIQDIRHLNELMIRNKSLIGTLASKIKNKALYKNENIVKVSTKDYLDNLNFPEAINFARKISKEDENIYHHLGIYSYKKETLKDFVSYNQSSNLSISLYILSLSNSISLFSTIILVLSNKFSKSFFFSFLNNISLCFSILFFSYSINGSILIDCLSILLNSNFSTIFFTFPSSFFSL